MRPRVTRIVASDAKAPGFDSELQVSVPKPSAARLVATAVALPPLGQFGNLSRGLVRQPSLTNVDFSLNKNWTMSERYRLQFRAEFFNLLNRTNFRAPNGNRSAAAFGTITQTYDPRQVQLGLKVNF